MLIHEDLARARVRQRLERAQIEGLADRVATARRWQRRLAAAERRQRRVAAGHRRAAVRHRQALAAIDGLS